MKTVMPPVVAADKPLTIVGCGILHKEVDWLVRKNGWQVETQFLDSALHNYLGKLSEQLNATLANDELQGRDTVVFYGCCHPQIDSILEKHHTLRTQGQNCIVMLIGYEKFMEELEKGAYFLLEDWALTWEPMISKCFGDNPAVIREIFHSSHKFMTAIRTPCSGDFTRAAEVAAAYVDLPLQWMDADLSHLEAVIADALSRKKQLAS
ncbi:MAG: DUF1638 domain-containing protein [Azonexaceae bacterium]|nr:DUF1638 domain-containing protein [Azonexaceae bacterium]